MDSKSKPNHRRSPSYDRFLDLPKFISSGAGDELNEDDVFWTGDFSEARSTSSDLEDHNHRHAFKEEQRSGILAALSDNRKPNRPVLYRKTSTSRIIPAIPKPKPPQERERDYSQSMPPPVRKFQQSAPVNVPMMMQRRKGGALADVDLDLDDEEEEMLLLPPHEIVARGSGNSTITTSSSVVEGVGRTLKGRDLRLVRNAVWRQTGFLD